MPYLISLILILAGSVIMNQLSRRLHAPVVVGQLIAGIVLGPAVLNLVHFTTFISYFFNLGVIILMFIAGMESNLHLLKRYLRPSIVVAMIGVLFPMIVMPLIGAWIHLSLIQSLFLGVTFSATSVSITVTVLREMKQLKSKAGTTILGAAVADDIIAVILLSLVSMLARRNIGHALIPSQDFFLLAACQILYFGLIWLLIKIIVPKVSRIQLSFSDPFAPTIIALVFCFAMSYLANAIGLSAITGSFFAGIAIQRTRTRSMIRRQTATLGHVLLIPIFFVSIGLSMTLSGIINHWLFLIGLTIAAILTKLCGAGIGGRLVGFDSRHAKIIGAGMISRGEVALIIAQIGLASHLISTGLYSTIISAIIITTAAAPLILKKFIQTDK